MPLWSNTDNAAGSPKYTAAQYNITPNTGNQTLLFGNNTADAFRDGQTVGVYGVDTNEMRSSRADGEPRPATTGWVLRTEGSGGRAGRVTNEVLVAMHGMTADAENTVFQQLAVVIDTHPVDAEGDESDDDIVTFSVVAHRVPTAGTLTYVWQTDQANGVYVNVAATGAYSNVTTATLSVRANTAVDQTKMRCLVLSTGATTKTTNPATLTIVA